MERGVLAIFAEASVQSSESLRSFVNYYNIPFFTWSYPDTKENDFFDKKSDSENDLNNADVTTTDSVETLDYLTTARPNLQKSKQIENKQDEKSFLLNMHPSLTSVLISLIKYNRWQNIYYVYNHDEGKQF